MTPTKFKRDWIGWRVRLIREVQTGVVVLPKGLEMTVETTRVRTRLVGISCSCCGIKARLTLHPSDTAILEFIEPPAAALPNDGMASS